VSLKIFKFSIFVEVLKSSSLNKNPQPLNHNKTMKIFILLCLLSFVSVTFAQTDSLRLKITHIIIAYKKANIGVAIDGLENNDTLSINGNKHFPMESVFKFHLAIAVLIDVDKGKLSLDQKVPIQKSDLLPNTWSPLRDKYPNGNIELTLRDLLSYTVSHSDNNGCDILFKLMGGTQKVDTVIHNLGIKDVAIQATEKEMSKGWNIQFMNWTTPLAAIHLLKKFNHGEVLTQKSTDLLWKIMTETSTGENRIKGELPSGTIVAHKTGTSGTNAQGVTAGINDIGIIVLPNGKHIGIAVFVSNSKAKTSVNEKIIADIAKATWDYYIKKMY
jgi:beta-lactamase class A